MININCTQSIRSRVFFVSLSLSLFLSPTHSFISFETSFDSLFFSRLFFIHHLLLYTSLHIQVERPTLSSTSLRSFPFSHLYSPVFFVSPSIMLIHIHLLDRVHLKKIASMLHYTTRTRSRSIMMIIIVVRWQVLSSK